MELVVVRHAIAASRDRQRWPDDRERPLTPEGRLKGRKAARGIRHLLPRPTVVLSSPLSRARETAEILVRAAGWPQARDCPALEPDAQPEQLFVQLGRMRESRIAVIGHQPHLGRLLAFAMAGDLPESALDLRKMGVACLAFEGPARPGKGRLAALLAPKVLRRLA